MPPLPRFSRGPRSLLRALALLAALSLARCRPAPTPPTPPAAGAAVPDAVPAASVEAPAASASGAPGASVARVCRSPLPFSPAAARPAAAPAAPAPRVLAACQAIARRSRLRAAAFFRDQDASSRDEWLAPVLGCHHAGEGAWTLEIVSSRAKMQEDDSGLDPSSRGTIASMQVRPVYVQPTGAAVPGPSTLELTGGTGHFILHTTVLAPRSFDWDGDGRGEFYFQISHAQEENNAEATQQDRFHTFTLRNGAVREFIPAASQALRIEDVDGDGRPDLVLRSPWVVEGPCGISSVFYPGPERLLRSLPGGQFSASDAVAQGFIAHQCRVRPARLLVNAAVDGSGSDEASPPLTVGCARWWGRSADEVVRELKDTYPDPSGPDARVFGCYPLAELERVARLDPPEAFRLSCP